MPRKSIPEGASSNSTVRNLVSEGSFTGSEPRAGGIGGVCLEMGEDWEGGRMTRGGAYISSREKAAMGRLEGRIPS